MTYILVYETHCIHIQTYFMKHVLFIMLRASKARVPKDLLLNAIIYIYNIYVYIYIYIYYILCIDIYIYMCV